MCGMKRKLKISSELFTRGVEEIVTRDELQRLLASGRQIRIKHGIDATSPNLHLGNAAPLWKIREMQEAGHKAVIILGEFTTKIGDPTGKSATRAMLPDKIIKRNIASIRAQIGSVLLTQPKVFELRKNSEWWERIRTEEFLKMASMITHARLIERDMFQKRIRQGREIAVSEILYPILQGYDSVAMKSDMTIIGSDQLFNEHLGRFFQEEFGHPPQVMVTLKILPGLDGGEKMSKSLGNYIGLQDMPRDKFGKAMRVRDDLIVSYLEHYTNLPLDAIADIKGRIAQGGNPMEAKLVFAQALVSRYHGAAAGEKEKEYFIKMFSRKELSDVPVIKIQHGSYRVLDLLARLGFITSKSEGRRLILQGAVEINGEVIKGPNAECQIERGTLIKTGKRRLARVD